MRKNYLTIVCVAVLHLLGASLFGSVPAKIKYQGILKKRGQFITASKSMKFSITDINSTSVYWTSGYVKVDVNQGVFTYVLEPSGIDWSAGGYYLEVRIMDSDTVGGTTANRETVLGPIEEIGSAVYAQIAREVEDNSVSSDKIQDGAVTDVKVSSVSWSKIFGIPSDLGAGAADSLGSHVATTTLDMNSFNISNASTISVSAVISDNVDGYDISDHFQTLGISTASLRNDISAVSVSTGTLIKRSGDTMSGTLNVSTISAVSRISFLDGTAITTAVGIGGAGDNLGTHTATATLDMAGHNIVNLAGYDVSQQFISIAVSTGDMRSDISSLETAVSNLENKKYNKTGGTVSGNISNLGYKIFTSSVQFADGTMLSSTMSLSSLSDNLGNHTATQDLNMSSMNILNPGMIDGYNLASQFANIDFSTAELNNNIFGVNSALDIEISSRQTADMDIGIDTGTLRSDIYKLSSDTISISMEIADLKYSTASLDSMKLDASSAAVTYLHNSSATATYLFKGETAANAELFDGYESYNFYFSTGGAISGDIINTGYRIYAGTIQFADGTLLDTTIGLSDNLGNHIATMTLDMSGYDINLNGGRIISSSGAGIVQIGNNMDMMNSSIMNVDNLIGDRAQFQNIYDSTGSLRGSLDIEISSRQAFDNAVGITTDSLKKEIDNLHISTGVLYDVKYNRAGGTLDGNMNNTGYRVITSSIQFADGTVFSSTGTFGDNLGNHTATKNINMGQNTIHNLLDLYAYGSFVFSGSTGPLHIEGPGARTFWYPSKSAFRSGYVADTQWDDIKIGEYSFAGGKNTIALGNSSTAFGNNTNANADYSTALGQGTTVSGTNSLVAGYQSTVSGDASVALGYQTDVIGNDSLAMGYQSSADGNVSLSVGYQSEANGYVSLSLGYKTIADGWYSTALGYNTYASGDSAFASGHFSTASGEYSSALGQWVTSSADNSIILGKGINNGSRLSNNKASTLMVGFERTVPTLFVSSVSVSVDNTSMTAGLNVSSINYVSRLGFADGTVMTSTKTLASLSDNLGNHTATQNLNMGGNDITNIGLLDGYDVSGQFGEVATSTNALNTSISDLALSTGAIQGNIDAISMSTVTLREDITALEVSTGALLSNTSAQDIYYPRTGGTISGPVTITSNVYTSGYRIYTNSIQFDDGTVIASTSTLASLSDNLGNHTATQDLNMNGKNITNAGLIDGYDISQQFGDVAGSTNSLKVMINELGLSTGALSGDVEAISMSTATLREDITTLAMSTGTLLDKSSATLTYLFKNETASDSMKLGGYGYEYYATTASIYEIGFDTGILSNDVYALKMDTGTLRTDINSIIVSTGDFVKKTGDTMTGELSVSTINVISQISFADGSIITSSSTLGDNLGNHTATQDLDMNGSGIVNASSLTVAGGGLVAMGTYGSGSIPLSGPGDRLMWYPAKVAFRAGGIDAAQWNDNNIGSYSVAMGTNTTASGWYSTALGGGSTASGTCSTAFGGVTTASGYAATSFGVSSIASGNWSFAVGSVSKAMGQISAAFGADTIAEGDASVSMGYKTTAKGYGAVAMGMNTTAGGHNSVALGFGSTSGGNYSTAIGSAVVTSNGEWSVGIGQYVRSDASNNIVLGRGADASNPLLNNKANSMVVGFDRTSPTLFVSSVSVSVDNTSMTAGLNVSSINYVSRLGFADGTVMTSTKTLASLSDNLGNHTATQNLNMGGNDITNIGLLDGYDVSQQFGDVAGSTNSLKVMVNELGLSTGALSGEVEAISMSTVTLREDITALEVSTGALLSNTSAQDIYYPRTGGTISGPVTITSNVYTSGYKIYTNSIQFDDGTVIASTKTLASLSDNLGNHTATQNLNMGGNDITNIGLLDGYDISQQFGDVAESTNSLKVMVNELGLSTGTLSGDVEAISMSTSTLREDITTLAMSTGTLLDKSSATLAYLFKNETASDSMKLGGYGYGYYATTASMYEIGFDTGILSNDVYALKMDTGTLRTDINSIIVSTGDFVKKTGDTMTGELNVSTINVISQISFADGSIITSSSTFGDNLGNHTATQNLNMGGNDITNIGLLDGYDISQQFGDVAGSTNSLKVMVNELGLSTGTLSGDMEAISMSTSTLREDITTLAMSTGTLLDKSSATLAYLFKNEIASDSMKLGGYEYGYYATTASIYEIGFDTGILSNDVYALKMDTGTLGSELLFETTNRIAADFDIGHDTGTLRTDMDVLAFSTGTLLSTASASAIYYSISGGNINGSITVSSNVYVNGYRLYISSIQFDDGTVIDSTASLTVAGEGGAGDNLGNHIASKNINLSGYGLFNVSSITLAGSILSTGTIGDIPAQGAGTRFMWYPGKAALRAGSVTGTQWDDANVGNYSIGIGQNVIASQSGSFALGKNISNATPDSFAAGFGPAPGLFVAGSSVAVNSTSFPAGNSISFYTVGAMLNSGTFGAGNSISAMTGIRMLWYPKLASFRVGGTDSTQWDHSNIGQYSFAAGYNTQAKGNNSVAMGIGTEANGLSSIAFGSQSIANGNQATAMGNTSFASGQNSTAIGNSAYASGYDSAAIGSDARATGHTSLSLGQYVNAGSSNTVVIGKGAFWNDPLINNTVDTFMVGFNRNKPSFTVFQSSINVDATAGFIEDVLTVSTGNVTVARIQGDGNAFANGAWNGAGADYAEWFRKEGDIETGDIVGLNASSGRTRRYEIGDVLIGVCSEKPAFVGNRDLDKTEQEMFADYALVGLVGQVDVKMDQVSVTGNKVATKDGKQIGYLMEDGKIFIRIKD